MSHTEATITLQDTGVDPPELHGLEPQSNIMQSSFKYSPAGNVKSDVCTSTNVTSSASNLGPARAGLPKRAPPVKRMINVIPCIPYSVQYKGSGEWVTAKRNTFYPLNEVLQFLSAGVPDQHMVVGWIGEIKLPSSDQSHVKRFSSTNRLVLSKVERDVLEKTLLHDCEHRIVPVWPFDDGDMDIDRALPADQSRWRRYPELRLHTVLHSKQLWNVEYLKDYQWWLDFRQMNERYANRVLEVYEHGDTVWIHDYHLSLVPLMLRQAIPDIHLGFYLHAPFPTLSYLYCLPKRKEVLEGILGAGLVGFGAHDDAVCFASACTRFLGFPSSYKNIEVYGRNVCVGFFPLGVDVPESQRSAFTRTEVDSRLQQLSTIHEGRTVIISRDRDDETTTTYKKLQGFEKFLAMYPQWRDKIVFVQLTTPVCTEERASDFGFVESDKIASIVTTLNSSFGSLFSVPVQYFTRYLPWDEYWSLLRLARVALITSNKEDVKTTALHYIVSQIGSYGSLIVSQFTTLSKNLSDALAVDPWNPSEIANALDLAMNIGFSNRKSQHAKMLDFAIAGNVHTYTKDFIQRLKDVASCEDLRPTQPLDEALLVRKYKQARRRLFLLDYDGTLTPIVRDADAAVPSERLLVLLKKLTGDRANKVWIVSGRDHKFLGKQFDTIDRIGLSAEHGGLMRYSPTSNWQDLTRNTDMQWIGPTKEVFEYYSNTVAGSRMECKESTITWHYRGVADEEYAQHEAERCEAELYKKISSAFAVEIMRGKAVVEVRSRSINKGAVVQRLLAKYHNVIESVDEQDASPEFVFCAGDDTTDESMFQSLRGINSDSSNFFTCSVGPSTKRTFAAWQVDTPEAVISALELLVGTSATEDSAKQKSLVGVSSIDAETSEDEANVQTAGIDDQLVSKDEAVVLER